MTDPTWYLPLAMASNITSVSNFLDGYTKNMIEPMVVIVALKAFTKETARESLLSGIIASFIS